ncbi:hypothetical protein GCM10010387_61920 [Streptomyces inusitatus]|uniref:Uncharacterized protein n=1 Tax=Streptomyces inusitatus TaxID=68221 RepID=A0A918QP78_9ACTN|nr:hypothetical protein [Streptomyces inusitatus]GGZ59765.1 hypothetical protein GCM10010387_61920 [Streptomyces inusitatus]
MDLRARLTRAALARPAVLLATSPGATRERLAVEAELGRRGWPSAAGPASADLLVFAGVPLPLRDDDWAERVWTAVPAPKARVTVTDAEHAAHTLDHGHRTLLTPAAHPAERHETATAAAPDHGPHDSQGSHGGMDHAHHGRPPGTVAGLPLAERAEDRDGLRLDRLHVPLGPALPDWPAGLVLRLELQGDVVRRAEVDPMPTPAASRPAFWSEPWLKALAGEPGTSGEAARRRCAAHLDSLGRFLGVAGWSDAATRARRARDRTLGDAHGEELRPLVHPLVRRVRKSRTLRWLTAGVGELPGGPVAGDAHSRLIGWLDGIEYALDAIGDRTPLADHPLIGPRGRVDDTEAPASRTLLAALPALLAGAEFACARLVVASLDPDLDELAARRAPDGRTHG